MNMVKKTVWPNIRRAFVETETVEIETVLNNCSTAFTFVGAVAGTLLMLVWATLWLPLIGCVIGASISYLIRYLMEKKYEPTHEIWSKK